jgi:hypothetical protein
LMEFVKQKQMEGPIDWGWMDYPECPGKHCETMVVTVGSLQVGS